MQTMQKQKLLPTSTIFLILIIALALLGVGYGIWSQSLFIRGTVVTGNVSAEFVRAFTDDDGQVDNPAFDSQDTGTCAISIGGDLSCDPADYGPDPKPHHDKAVGVCIAEILGDPTHGAVTQKNVYPGYFCTAWFAVQNNGSIPVKVGSATINGQAVTPGLPTPMDLSGDSNDDIVIRLTGLNICQQIDPGETVWLEVDHEILSDAPQAASMSYEVEVQLNQWNQDCQPPGVSMPVFTVAQAGLTNAQATALAEGLGIPADQVAFEDGAVLFIDPVGFQAVPTMPVEADELIRLSENDGGTIAAEGFDFAGIGRITPISDQVALRQVQQAFEKTDLLPANGRPTIMHSIFEAVEVSGSAIVERAQLDTQVHYRFMLNGVPLIGPGAQVSVAFGPSGAPTQFVHSLYSLSEGELVQVIPPSEAAEQCAALFEGRAAKYDPRLVYYAPPLLGGGAQTILPHYDCGGVIPVEQEQANLLRTLVPAVESSELLPAVNLSASLQGEVVFAEAQVSGGKAPYSFAWSSSSADLSGVPADASKVEYVIQPRDQSPVEIVQVVVTDANGIQAQASQALSSPIGARNLVVTGPRARPALVGGVTDFGVERAVSDLGAGNQSGYVNRMDDEAFKRFNWTGPSAWEIDFKQGGGGIDHLYVDNVDTLFYIGHGWGGGFTFESNVNDGSIVPADVVGAWGNVDLEWLTLLSCQVLKAEHGGQMWWQRWGPAFDGLHLLTGFQTNAYDVPAFGGRFADYMLGRKILFFELPPLPVRSAWFQASLDKQPGGVQAVVMGVYGPNGLTSYNDYFWGQGNVSPDLRGNNIRGYWRVVVTVP